MSTRATSTPSPRTVDNRSVIRRAAQLAALLLLAAPAHAQINPAPPPTRIEAGGQDEDPARASLRNLQQTDLRNPTGFEYVYRLDRRDSHGRMHTSYMRLDGGLAAVFPRSQYAPTADGYVPEIPAGTVFHIGVPASSPALPSKRPDTMIATNVDTRASTNNSLLAPAGSTLMGTTPSTELSMFEDENYRRYRVKDMLLRALEVDVRAGIVSLPPLDR